MDPFTASIMAEKLSNESEADEMPQNVTFALAGVAVGIIVLLVFGLFGA